MDYAATILSKLPGASKRDHGMRHLVDTLQTYLPQEQIDTVVRAYECGAVAHEGQTRKTGEPYISHPVAVAQSLFPNLAHHPAAAGLRVHMANGLYLNATLDRLIGGFRTSKPL